MICLRMALPVSALLVSLTLPSIGQTSDDSRKESFVPMQTQSQVSNAAANAADRQLGADELGDLYMARKHYREPMTQYKALDEQVPHNRAARNSIFITC